MTSTSTTTFTATSRTEKIGPQTPAEMQAFEQAISQIRQEAHAKVGEKDARYVRRTLAIVRITEALGRGLLMFGWFPPTWFLGTFLLGISKIVDNMELGHNVMHGQFNWMNDPRFHGDSFEWDQTCPKEEWRHSHNFVHHTYTNVIGKDRDFGYGLLRLTADLRWSWLHPFQLFLTAVLASFFEWFVAIHDMQLDKIVIGRRKWADVRPQWLIVRAKIWRQVSKDYIAWPLAAWAIGAALGLGSDLAWAVLVGNVIGNFIRNIWAWAIIFCGHFTENVYTFTRESIENESQGHWYLRQILGSSNIQGGRWLHFFSGNLSHQVEHHLFPDLPANRYAEIAPQVQAVCQQYGIPYNTGSFFLQLMTVIKRIGRYSLPGGKAYAVNVNVTTPSHEQGVVA